MDITKLKRYVVRLVNAHEFVFDRTSRGNIVLYEDLEALVASEPEDDDELRSDPCKCGEILRSSGGHHT